MAKNSLGEIETKPGAAERELSHYVNMAANAPAGSAAQEEALVMVQLLAAGEKRPALDTKKSGRGLAPR